MRTLLILSLVVLPLVMQAQNHFPGDRRSGDRDEIFFPPKRASTHRNSSTASGSRNILTFTPISGIVLYGDVNPAAGIDYEYLLGKKRLIGIHVPVMIAYTGPDGGFNNYRRTVFFAAPGIRFHADGGRGRVDFSTGPSILIGNAHYRYNSNYYNPNPGLPDYNYGLTGIVVDNAINIQERSFIFGFNVRTGYTFDRQNDSRYFLQLGMHFGLKFL